MMLFQRDSRPVSCSAWTPCSLLQATLVLLLLQQLLPSATAKLFSAKSKKTGKVTVLVDLKFKLYVGAWKNVKEFSSIEFTDMDVEKVQLYEIESGNLKTLELIFKGFFKDAGFLSYRFLKYDSPNVVGLVREFELAPGFMFLRVDSLLARVKFAVPEFTQENLGLAKTSYLCETEETISFVKTSTEVDGYKYVVKLETSYFHAQAFNINDSQFSSEPPTVCKEPSSSSHIVIIASASSGIAFLVALAAIILVLVVRHSRQKQYETYE
ncbi:hypothetical protein RRG08_043695 [Elysia crispata]|uniref:Uncharacterized protein n=1 Tax=Elysia crispata TaxID=231223 RepID=A0AAE0ZNI8_9GAST|nr:hypothetical protein RRG08_043695 [Elysia crispata]